MNLFHPFLKVNLSLVVACLKFHLYGVLTIADSNPQIWHDPYMPYMDLFDFSTLYQVFFPGGIGRLFNKHRKIDISVEVSAGYNSSFGNEVSGSGKLKEDANRFLRRYLLVRCKIVIVENQFVSNQLYNSILSCILPCFPKQLAA